MGELGNTFYLQACWGFVLTVEGLLRGSFDKIAGHFV